MQDQKPEKVPSAMSMVLMLRPCPVVTLRRTCRVQMSQAMLWEHSLHALGAKELDLIARCGDGSETIALGRASACDMTHL